MEVLPVFLTLFYKKDLVCHQDRLPQFISVYVCHHFILCTSEFRSYQSGFFLIIQILLYLNQVLCSISYIPVTLSKGHDVPEDVPLLPADGQGFAEVSLQLCFASLHSISSRSVHRPGEGARGLQQQRP